jgi:hypothetical protein
LSIFTTNIGVTGINGTNVIVVTVNRSHGESSISVTVVFIAFVRYIEFTRSVNTTFIGFATIIGTSVVVIAHDRVGDTTNGFVAFVSETFVVVDTRFRNIFIDTSFLGITTSRLTRIVV